MKKILSITAFLLAISSINNLIAQDDVYDAPKSKIVKIRKTYTEPTQPSEQSVPYYDEQDARVKSNIQNDGRQNNYDDRDQSYYSDDNSSYGFGYSDRIRRFHNSSIQFIVIRSLLWKQEKLLHSFPQLERYFRLIYQKAYSASQLRTKYLYDFSREEFYHHFNDNFPEFTQRIPQHILASYLNMTPEYLSKIKNKSRS